jgi:hypothetical protein
MRVTGRTAAPGESSIAARRAQMPRGTRTNSQSSVKSPLSPGIEKTPTTARQPPTLDNGFFSPSGRPRADSAPMPALPGAPSIGAFGSSMAGGRARGLPANGVGGIESGAGLLEMAMSVSETSGRLDEDDDTGYQDVLGTGNYAAGSLLDSDRPSEVGMSGVASNMTGIGGEIVDEGSDVDEDEVAEYEQGVDQPERRHSGLFHMASDREEERRSSTDEPADQLEFAFVAVNAKRKSLPPSALTIALNRHVPHLVSTSASAQPTASSQNPFASLYASVSAPLSVPSLSIDLYYPHSDEPTDPITVKVRKDASVEEVIGFGLWKYWEEGREPKLREDEGEEKLSAVGWGLRMVEDDGEVDEDFPGVYNSLSNGDGRTDGSQLWTGTARSQSFPMANLL